MRKGLLPFAFFAVFFGFFFAPAEIGKLMASGDAVFESLPALLGPHHLWSPAILLGYPLYADPNQQMWYPLARLASLPDAYNAFAVAPFVIAAFGMGGFVRATTGSIVGAIVSGLVYALGGFMISHAGHLMLSHPAAWAPYVLWSIEAQRRYAARGARAGGAVALGLCAVAGQPEILAFTIALAACYAAASARSAVGGPRRYACGTAGMLAAGIGLGCVQLVPEAVLAHTSTRASLSFSDYTIFQIPISQIAMRAFFPYVLGPTHLAGYRFSTVDLGTFTEDTMAVGIVASVLALLASAAVVEDRRVIFWFAMCAVALLLAIGDATPLAKATHALPIYNLFRIPGRHAFELSFAVAMLAGYGSKALVSGRASGRRITVATVTTLALVAIGFAQFTLDPSNARLIAQTYGAQIGAVVSPITNGAIGIPLLCGFIGIALICVAARFRETRGAGALLILAVAIDAGTFGYAAYWNWDAIDARALDAPGFVNSLAKRLAADDTRIAWIPGNLAPALGPNLTTLWDVATVDGYTPLVPRRTSMLLGSTPSGGLAIPGSDDANLDLAGASILALPLAASAAVSAAQPIAPGSIHIFFAAHRDDARTHYEMGLPHPIAATAVAYVSELGDSVGVPQNADVATLSIVYTDGHVQKHEILAGRDTSEFAYDRPDVRPLVKHARAKIFSNAGAGHTYIATVATDAYRPIARLAVEWHYATAALTLENVSLVDSRTNSAQAFGPLASIYARPSHWVRAALDPTITAFRNAAVRPHAWLARPVRVDDADAAYAIHFGTLPTGNAFRGASDALVTDGPTSIEAPAPTDRVAVGFADDGHVAATVRCARRCYAVFRDAYDPANWKAEIDGTATATYATDLDLRGVAIPAGIHHVLFRFFPLPLYVGSIVTGISLLLVLAFLRVVR